MKKLQILVNHYQQSEQIVTRFLSSLEIQKKVKFEVIICSDGGLKLTENFLNNFNLQIIYKYLPHSGVCHTRNILLDLSDAEYIMFCDIDDCFSSPYGLYLLLSAIETTNTNIVGSTYSAEFLRNNKYIYQSFEKDTIRLHGKIFRKQYLTDNNIRFPDELVTSGDMYFLWLCYGLTENYTWIKNDFYIWKYNPNSITRNSPFSRAALYERTIKCYTLLAQNQAVQNIPRLYQQLIISTVTMMYLDDTSKKWDKVPQSIVQNNQKVIYKYLKRFSDFYKTTNPKIQYLNYFLTKQRESIYQTADKFENINQWIEKKLQKGKLLCR